MLYFATLFDQNYLNKGLALYESLDQHVKSFKLFVLCLDDVTYEFFAKESHENVHAIRLIDIEHSDEELRIAKSNRNRIEYYFTLSPVLPLYILTNYKGVDFITTLDADIFFYSDPAPIYKEFDGKSILITPHRFPAQLKEKENYGLYNVSFQIFRNDPEGINCLTIWRRQCIEWCYDKLEGNRFADQKYLDSWPAKFTGVAVLQNSGAGLAPWNISSYSITKRNGIVYCNDNPLIFYHFHYLKAIRKRWFTHGIDLYKSDMNAVLRRFVYHPYILTLIRLSSQLRLPGHQLTARANSSPKNQGTKEILKNYSTLFNIGFIGTLEIDIRRLFQTYRKFSIRKT